MVVARGWRPSLVALAFAAASVGGVVALPSSSAATSVTIWPLGDSITYGSGVHPHRVPGGYRVQLVRALASRGIRVHFVGTMTTNPAAALTGAGQRHDGHPGWQTSEVLAHLAGWKVPPPDVVLVHLGTNDLRHGRASPAEAAARLEQLLSALSSRFPQASLVVATIVPSGRAGQCDVTTSEYDGLVRELVRQQALMGRRVSLADAWSEFNYGPCTTRPGLLSRDAVHPSAAGYRLLGQAFAEVVAPLVESGRTLTP
ncbi:MAG: hypothetical protein QOJ92_1168 [Frankiales bacterium]|nr:hypothetical protein [Frankiales bacterium]